MTAIVLGLHHWRGSGFEDALVTGFDVAALIFIVSLLPLGRDQSAMAMRLHAQQNDGNRGWVLMITAVVAIAILAAIVAELPAARHDNLHAIIKLVVTLGLGWTFTNLVFMLHYAHMYYMPGPDGDDARGFRFPQTPEPDYWDFLYFSFTAGMSFAASDVNVTRGEVRRIVVAHCILAFLFNIGVLAFSINVLAGAAT
ncbi:MAG: DUF1345 domain-containing protein [Proteobacteria bacterium]|nr:DUF1345 domain-containing protein [Pseudomonadota bacterium]